MKPPRTLVVANAVGWVTFREIIRDRVLYNVFACSFLLLGAQWLASRLTVIHSDRVLLDFGLSAISLSMVLLGALTGAGLLGREIRNRTFHVALCRPISKAQFILGKFTGLSLVLILNGFLLSAAYLGMLWGAGSTPGESVVSWTLMVALLFSLIQGIVVAGLSILISTISTTSLSVILVLGLYLIGSSITQLKAVAAHVESPFGRTLLNGIATVLPNFQYFQLGTKVTYGLPVSALYVSQSALYGGVVIALALLLSGLLIQIREV